MGLNRRAVPVACGLLLALAGGRAGAELPDSRYWAWAPGCSGHDMGTTTLCWSDQLRLPSGSGNVGGATRPGPGNAAFIIQDGATTLPVSFASGALDVLGVAIAGVDAPAQVALGNGSLKADRILVGVSLAIGYQPQWSGPGQLLQSAGSVSVTDRLFVGNTRPNGVASLYELGGGTLAAKSVTVGRSYLYSGSDLLELEGAGRLTVRGTASVSVGDELLVDALGVLDLRDGLVRAGWLQLAAPEALQFSGGTLELTGPQTVAGAAPSFGSLTATRALLRVAPGARANFAGPLAVGAIGRGELQVAEGAQLTTAGGVLGRGAGGLLQGDGDAIVEGAGARWTNTGALDIGVVGSGRLQVLGGGQVSSVHGSLGSALLAAAPLRRNSVWVSGAGSAWLNSGSLSIGGSEIAAGGSGDVVVDAGGHIGVGGALRVWGDGTLHLAGGASVDAGAIATAPGSVVTLQDSHLRSGSEALFEGALTVLAGEASRIDGAVTVTGSARLQVDAGQLIVGGPMSFEAGAQLHLDGDLFALGDMLLRPGVAIGGTGTKFVFARLTLGEDYLQVDDPGALALLDGSVLDIDIGGAAGHDRYAASRLILGGTLLLRSADGYHGRDGDHFDLLDGPIFGQFSAVDTGAFALDPGLAWDFSRLGTEGVVAITTAVPEPAGSALWLAGLAALGGYRLRRRRATPASASSPPAISAALGGSGTALMVKTVSGCQW